MGLAVTLVTPSSARNNCAMARALCGAPFSWGSLMRNLPSRTWRYEDMLVTLLASCLSGCLSGLSPARLPRAYTSVPTLFESAVMVLLSWHEVVLGLRCMRIVWHALS